MYAWIWRHLPFGVPGKLGGSLLLIGAVAGLLWFVVFPWADPWIEETLLPWNEGQLEGDFGPGGEPGGPASPGGEPGPAVVDESGQPLPSDPHDIPYETE